MATRAPKRGAIELELSSQSFIPVGVDEVGRGCLAGPVAAAAAVLDYERLWSLSRKKRSLIRDSKKLTSEQRQNILPVIHEIKLAAAIGFASVDEIESKGIVEATFLAMRRALAEITVPFTDVLVDGKLRISNLDHARQRTIIKGETAAFCIAAASIIAKEARDAFMREQAANYPHYGFDRHVGYGTLFHRRAIAKFGICILHRKNFAPVRESIYNWLPNESIETPNSL